MPQTYETNQTQTVNPNPTYTPRQLTARIKKILAKNNICATVKSKTWSFEGFGYGKACTALVRVDQILPESVTQELKILEEEFKKSGQGPTFSEKQPSAFRIELQGQAYPFGGKI